ncbi:MAG TPA: hypothetical protein VJA21_12480 [Verrucomicrobiae bacterium]
MRRLLTSLLIALLLVTCGCARHYIMRLSNGGQLTTYSKPRLKGASYYFKDAKGQLRVVPASRVAEIMPASMAKEEKSPFKPETR